jgi:hypothetical protein
MSVVMTASNDRPVQNRAPARHAGLRPGTRPPTGTIFKFRDLFSTPSTGPYSLKITQVVVKEMFNNLTNYQINHFGFRPLKSNR